MVRAAWSVYQFDRDAAELLDSLQRVVAREKERATSSRQHLVDALRELAAGGSLTQDDARLLTHLVVTGHPVSVTRTLVTGACTHG